MRAPASSLRLESSAQRAFAVCETVRTCGTCLLQRGSSCSETLNIAAQPAQVASTITRNCDPRHRDARSSYSSDIHLIETSLKHAPGKVVLSTRPSNREGFKDSFGGLRAVRFYL